MNIPKFDNRNIKPWMKRNPFLARAFLLALLPIAPLIYASVILLENRRDFREIGEMIRAIFLPWKHK